MLLLALTVHNLTINVSITRLILVKREDFDGRLIRLIYSPLADFNITGLMINLIILVTCLTAFLIFLTRVLRRMLETVTSFTNDARTGKLAFIEDEFNAGNISEEEAGEKKAGLNQEADFLSALNGACRFLSGNEIVRIFLVLVNSCGGVLIGSLLKNEALEDALFIYIPLAIGGGILSMIPAVLLCAAVVYTPLTVLSVGCSVSRFNRFFNNDLRYFYAFIPVAVESKEHVNFIPDGKINVKPF
jgi:flagellar biosynthesis protein FlhA